MVSHDKGAVVGTISLVKVITSRFSHDLLRIIPCLWVSCLIMTNLGMGFFGFMPCGISLAPLVGRFYILPNLGIFQPSFFLQLFFFFLQCPLPPLFWDSDKTNISPFNIIL